MHLRFKKKKNCQKLNVSNLSNIHCKNLFVFKQLSSFFQRRFVSLSNPHSTPHCDISHFGSLPPTSLTETLQGDLCIKSARKGLLYPQLLWLMVGWEVRWAHSLGKSSHDFLLLIINLFKSNIFSDLQWLQILKWLPISREKLILMKFWFSSYLSFFFQCLCYPNISYQDKV